MQIVDMNSMLFQNQECTKLNAICEQDGINLCSERTEMLLNLDKECIVAGIF